jgi:hypothetical protein
MIQAKRPSPEQTAVTCIHGWDAPQLYCVLCYPPPPPQLAHDPDCMRNGGWAVHADGSVSRCPGCHPRRPRRGRYPDGFRP